MTEEQARWTPPYYKGLPHMTGSILDFAFHAGSDTRVLLSHYVGDQSVAWEQTQSWALIVNKAWRAGCEPAGIIRSLVFKTDTECPHRGYLSA